VSLCVMWVCEMANIIYAFKKPYLQIAFFY
jgi:hypothetical protein